ncbi:hypothetical protein ABID26_004613 [Mesorhizobium shonense]|uniref:Integrase n=1 Tax=Mesorhizobium shonense TaxID=1209948 RepID=A0ABV2HXA2_9HYPH
MSTTIDGRPPKLTSDETLRRAAALPTPPAYRRLSDLTELARVAHGLLFRRITGQGKNVGAHRLNDLEVARLVKLIALVAGVRGDLSEGQRGQKFSGHSLRAGLASSAEVD